MRTLYIVSTPIGNLGDITYRSLEVLKSVDLVLCEDTRVTGKLLNHFDIKKPLIAFNDFNEEKKITSVISDFELGKDIALVSDAGTPLISDPGFKLVRESLAKGINVVPIPGVSAATAALVASGLPTDKFMFIGYLPKKEGKRKKILGEVKRINALLPTTMIFYESPYRVLKLLSKINEDFDDIDIVVCRELTKMHEEIRREKVTDAILHFNKVAPKGEFVVLI